MESQGRSRCCKGLTEPCLVCRTFITGDNKRERHQFNADPRATLQGWSSEETFYWWSGTCDTEVFVTNMEEHQKPFILVFTPSKSREGKYYLFSFKERGKGKECEKSPSFQFKNIQVPLIFPLVSSSLPQSCLQIAFPLVLALKGSALRTRAVSLMQLAVALK